MSDVTIEERVAARFLFASTLAEQRQRLQRLEDELETLERLQEDIEGFVFMEETATELMAKAHRLSQQLPDLKVLDREVQSGLADFHNHVLNDLMGALDELDEAVDRRTTEAEELREQGVR